MTRLPLEYTLCQIQSGQISLAIRTHRREQGTPELEISVGPNNVTFTLLNLFDGVPQAVMGERRQDHVDFYFLLDEFRRIRNTLPAVATAANRGLLLPNVDPTGMERRGGRQIRMDLGGPLFRLAIEGASIESIRDPLFRAIADEAQLFADFETTPSRGQYTQEHPEIHFGVNGTFNLVDATGVTADVCRLTLSHEQYATWRSEVLVL